MPAGLRSPYLSKATGPVTPATRRRRRAASEQHLVRPRTTAPTGCCLPSSLCSCRGVHRPTWETDVAQGSRELGSLLRLLRDCQRFQHGSHTIIGRSSLHITTGAGGNDNKARARAPNQGLGNGLGTAPCFPLLEHRLRQHASQSVVLSQNTPAKAAQGAYLGGIGEGTLAGSGELALKGSTACSSLRALPEAGSVEC